MTRPPAHATVLDTTVLSNFAHVDHVEVLLDLPRPVTVDAVRDELEAGAETHQYIENALTVLGEGLPVITPSGQAETLEAQLLETLDPGEAQVLAVAEAAGGIVGTDDGDARTAATTRGVDLTGSIGFLVQAVEAGHVSAQTADEYLKRWIDEAGFRSPARDFEVFLDE